MLKCMTSLSCNCSHIITATARANVITLMHSKPRSLCERTCLSVSDSTIHYSTACYWFPMPRSPLLNPSSCAPNFQQHSINPHSKYFETCMPDLPYHSQLDVMHALGKSDPHSYTQWDQLHTYGSDLLGVYGTQEPIEIAQMIFSQVQSQALLQNYTSPI